MEEYRYMHIHVFLTLAVNGGEWSASCPCLFTPGRRATGTHGIRGWVDPKVGLNVKEKRNIWH
jgi:hypothetical protein